MLVLTAGGCGRSTTGEQQEFARLSRAIDEVRNADNRHKQALLPRLVGAACERECVLRDGCAKAYGLHVRALLLLDQVKSQKDAIAEVEKKLSESEDLLAEARQQIDACTTMQSDRRRALGL